MTKTIAAVILVTGLFLLSSVTTAVADYYKYTNGNGVVSMTNKLESVPLKYRSTMKVIPEAPAKTEAPASAAPQEAASPRQADAAASGSAAPGKFEQLSARFVWFRPAVYIALFLLSLAVIGKICSLLSSRLLGRCIYVAFFMGSFVFLYRSYSNHAVDTYLKLKHDATAIVDQSKERQKTIPLDEFDSAKPGRVESGTIADRPH